MWGVSFEVVVWWELVSDDLCLGRVLDFLGNGWEVYCVG